MSVTTAEHFVRVGMVAVIRDVQDYIDSHTCFGAGVDAGHLRAYLLGQLIVADGYHNPFDDPAGSGQG